MKAKLIKTEVNYLLENKEGVIIASTSLNKEGKSLSKQNCDEIFGIVNVEELAQEVCDDTISSPYHCYIAGFNKAMELNKDKVFTLDDMYDAVMLGVCFEYSGIQGISTYEELKELAIKRASKPTEIEVMIVMECDGIQTGLCSEDCDCNVFPKLDSEGCLVLTKKI
jgi:hypothetical protein